MRTSQNLVAWRRLNLSGFRLLLTLTAWAASAIAAPIDTGIGWLTAAQRADGAWGEALPLQATIEVVGALREIAPTHTSITPGTAYLQTAAASNIDSLARIVATTTAAPTDLLALQNADGGWGLAGGFGSEPWTTALALRALVATGNGTTTNATQAVNWLLAARLEDGGWAYTPGETSRVAVAAEVVRALGSVPRNLDIQATLDRALTLLRRSVALTAARRPRQYAVETGLVQALAAAGGRPCADRVRDAGVSDGCQRPLAVRRAIRRHRRCAARRVAPPEPAGPPDHRRGDGAGARPATGQALAGVTARRYGETVSALTDVLGRFTLDGLPAGSVTLEFSKGGYLT